MKIITLEQRSPEWLAWRQTGIGASDAAAILGKSIWMTPQELWELKMGIREPQPTNPYMQRGVDYEDEARMYFGGVLNEEFAPLCAEHDEADFIKASFDGVDITKTIGLEIKVPGAKAHQMARDGYVPPYYMPQIQHQLMIGNFDSMFYGSYLPETKTGILIQVPRDNAMIDELWEAEFDFWRHVQEGAPMYTPEWAEASAIWLATDVDYQAAKKAKEAAAARLESLHPAGMSSFKAAGVSASSWTKLEGMNWEGFAQAHNLDMAQIDAFRPPARGPVDEDRLLMHLGLKKADLVAFQIRSKPIYTVKKSGGKNT